MIFGENNKIAWLFGTFEVFTPLICANLNYIFAVKQFMFINTIQNCLLFKSDMRKICVNYFIPWSLYFSIFLE